MKKLLYCAAALALGFFSGSCQRENLEPVANGGVTYTITLPEAVQTKGQSGYEEYDLYYEVYKTVDAEALETAPLLFENNKVPMKGNTTTVTLDLLNDQDYTVLFWANKKDVDYFDLGDLRKVTVKSAVSNNNDRDAFCGKDQIAHHDGTKSKTVTLKRPFAQLNIATIVTTTAGYAVTPVNSKVTVYGAPVTYNVFDGAVSGETTIEYDWNTVPAEKKVNDTYDLVAMNYVLVPEGTVDVEYWIETVNGTVNNTVNNVPVKVNYRTNIIGNLLTSDATYTVEIKPGFDTPAEVVDVWDGTTITAPEYDDVTETYTVDSGSDLAWLAAAVNGTLPTRASENIDFNGETFTLTSDIDLGGYEWTPISMSNDLSGGKSFRGTFDGNGHTISGLTVNQKEVAGLFGYVYAATIKNVTVANASINSNHFAGGIVGWVLNTTGNIQVPFVLENCHVKNSTITASAELVNGEWDNGDKVGGLIGYACFADSKYPANAGAKISNCSVENTTIKAYRDFGGLLGYAAYVPLENCTTMNVTLQQDLDHDYKNPTPTTFGLTIGRNEGGNTIDGYAYHTDGVAVDSEGAYCIYSPEGLYWLAEQINSIPPYEASEYDNATFKLIKDIDLDNREWTPIGDWASQRTEFHGTFDGQDHTVSNFKITHPKETGDKKEDSAYGLFGNVKGGTVKNLTVSDVTVSGVAKFAAALVGRFDGTIENCHVKNSSVVCSSWQVGGLVAQYNAGNISGCTVSNTTISSGVGAVGAIAGYALYNVERTIENCAVNDCTLVQTKPYGAGYDDMFATILGGVHVANTVININGCTAENNTIRGKSSNELVGYIEPGAKVYVDGNLHACAETTEQLEAALKAGGHISLVNNVTMTKSLALSNANFTLEGNGYTVTMADDATNTYALFDITGGKAAFKNVTFDGVKSGAVVRTVGVEFNAENVTAQNGQHTQQQGLFRLVGKSTIKNCTFKNNTCSMVITLNYDGANNDPQVVENCVFEGNTCNGTAALYYVKGASATINANRFVGNTVNCNSNGATIYMGFTENNVVTNNLFQNNTVNEAGDSARVAGGIFFGYETVFTGNAFVGNAVTGVNAKGNDVCVSTYYTDIDLSGNYWGGEAPVEDTNYFVQHKTSGYKVVVNDYLTVNPIQ